MSVLAPRVSSFFLQELTTRTTMSYPGAQVTPPTPRDGTRSTPRTCRRSLRGLHPRSRAGSAAPCCASSEAGSCAWTRGRSTRHP